MSAVPDEVMKYVANAKDDEDPQANAKARRGGSHVEDAACDGA